MRKPTPCHYPPLDNGLSKHDLQSQVKDLRRRVSTLEQFLGLIKTVPEEHAATMLEHVRAGTDVDSLLNNFTEADLLLQLSVVPETRRRYDFPYAKQMPAHLLFEGNDYLHSFVYEATFYQHSSSPTPRRMVPNDSYQQFPITFLQDTYDKPFRAATIADPMLEKIDISKWTIVTSDNRALRKYLGSYFRTPSVLSPVFHKDLFLEDMMTGETRFASKLLVNAVLAAGCQGCLDLEDRWMLWHPENIAYKFMSECKRLWDLEPPERSRLTTVQAALILNITYNLNANDFIAIRYLDQACDMATALGLFEPARHDISSKSYRARAITAWAVWSRQALTSLTYSRPFKIEKPPQMCLPDPSEHHGFYADVRVQYPLSEQLESLHVDYKIYFEAQLYLILGEKAGSPPVEQYSLADAFRLKKKLDFWFARVTTLFEPKILVFPIHFDLHMQYYYWIMRLFLPFSDQSSTPVTPLATAINETPQEIVRYSQAMFETLLRLYYLRHSYDTYDAWIIHFLLLLGTNALKSLYSATPMTQQSVDILRSSILLAAEGLRQQGKNVYIAQVCALGLQKSMRPDDLQWVQTHLSLRPVTHEEQSIIDESARCSYPVPIVCADGKLDTRKLGEIVTKFEEPSVEEKDPVD
ncbi:uncharacterized protein CC84DRAFT_1090661 [Paraphaeosphaeria sporulosa]|uniref:Xylanolytic transcriptional activator regulatory domain-containing protein n=1 Tax=Paraphaeosphaeria sporulosa TaxID=1460663 RepID=A0A177CH06_9PLEO|nr:uncharacterized protein CC84DRAFT_1090661 [Paraphaeosphaeria sporulosa]OAG06511.1 hypothetical protein CC84DRAFT_1090661 [Paraphaeosphaeria sporulosa]